MLSNIAEAAPVPAPVNIVAVARRTGPVRNRCNSVTALKKREVEAVFLETCACYNRKAEKLFAYSATRAFRSSGTERLPAPLHNQEDVLHRS
ncbi:hypothetical protein CEXT_143871 [Caerostris extrusa]|uniref:Uncharacterized protein n=1 Tax=Caerostris extrusa TaxID=172846 RepID=A0AAV4WE76_CAEEX|nr:hypothetical protein CEXT_143871 [Caerostris extrusa]